MVDKVGRILAVLALIAIAFAVLGRGWLLTKEGQPSDQELRSAMADVLAALDVPNSVSKPILHKFLYVELGRDVPYGMTQQAVSEAVSTLGHQGWSRGKARDNRQVTLCRGKLLVTLDLVQENAESAGHISVSWGDTDVVCPG